MCEDRSRGKVCRNVESRSWWTSRAVMAGLLCPRSWGSGGECWDSGCDSAQHFGGRADSFVGYHLDYRYIEYIQSRTEKRRGKKKKANKER